MEIVLATQNLHKVREFRDMLKILKGIDLDSLINFSDYTPPEETGTTFRENAILKAEHAAKALNRWVIADDSGLIIPALKGSPGIHSARYAGADATDSENRKKLLDEMAGMDGIERSAYIECCLALASPKGVKKVVTGICEGYITMEERGRNGHGYDPLFVKIDYNETFAEMEEQTKNRISHRRKAFDKLLPTLESIITQA